MIYLLFSSPIYVALSDKKGTHLKEVSLRPEPDHYEIYESML